MLKHFWANKVGAAVLLLCVFLLTFGFIKSTQIPDDVVAVNASLGSEFPTVILDAGHGGIDSGCVSVNGAEEKDINLKIMLKVRGMLEASGLDVVVTRDSDRSIHDSGVQGLGKQKQYVKQACYHKLI